ncbi:MAG: hypothetical protein Q9170_000588 [Blastenia crenularia]
MLDPLTAISLASAIVQFVDFSIKIVSQIQEIYQSASGATRENVTISEITEDIKVLNHNIWSNTNPLQLQASEMALQRLAESCETEADALLLVLAELKVPPDASHWLSFKKAIKGARQKGKVQELETRLGKLQKQANSRLLYMMNDQQSSLSLRLDEISQQHSSMQLHSVHQIEQLRADIRWYAQRQKEGNDQAQLLITKLHLLAEEGKRVANEERILESLRFDEWKRRFIVVKKAHMSTYEWMLEDSNDASIPPTGFRQWLQLQNGIFWICGKAGSGKSTLMKFLSEHPKDEPWSVDELSGVIDRLSQQYIPGIRFCLLIDGLDEYDGLPNDIVRVLKSLAKSDSFKLCVSSRPWNEFEEAFGEGKCDGTISLEKFTKRDIERFVKDILEKDETFTAAEQRDRRYGQFVQDVIDRAQGVFLWVELVVNRLLKGLGEKNRLDDLQKKLERMPPTLEEYFQRIFDKIDVADETESAQVFLTTAHAVQPLSIAAYHYLEQEGREPGYAKRAPVKPMSQAQLLTLYKDVHDRLNFLCKDLIEINKVTVDASFVDYQVDFLHKTVKDFLMTKDMHELLLKRATEDHENDWNTYRSLCQAALARAKSLPLQQGIRPGLNTLFNLVDEFMYYAHEVEVEQVYTDTELLDSLDEVISSFAQADMVYHWSNARDPPRGTYFDEHNQNTFLGLAVQSRLNLYVKKKLEANPNLLRAKKGRPYLDYAFRPNIKTPTQLPHLVDFIDFDLVRTLLEKGADPNQAISIYGDISVWGIFLLHINETKDRSDANAKGKWFQAAEVMIRKGADRGLKLETTRKETFTRGSEQAAAYQRTAKYKQVVSRGTIVEMNVPVELSASSILKDLFGPDRAAELEAILPETPKWGLGSILTNFTKYLRLLP